MSYQAKNTDVLFLQFCFLISYKWTIIVEHLLTSNLNKYLSSIDNTVRLFLINQPCDLNLSAEILIVVVPLRAVHRN